MIKLNKKNLVLILMTCIMFSSCAVSPTSAENQIASTPVNIKEQITATPFTSPSPSAEPTPTTEPYTSIVIGSTGDIMIHEMMLKDAQNTAEGDDKYTTNGDESYSFDHWFRHIQPSLEYADLMIGNFETTIAVDNSFAAGYPYFATPAEILPALKTAGFDVLLSGNNHILDKNQDGLIATVNAIDEAGFYHTGAWDSLESKNTPLVIDVEGIKIGIVSATCSVNDQDVLLSPEENEYMYLKTDNLNEISNQIANCKNYGAEVIVMCPHWGYEYTEKPISTVTQLAQEYIKLGADIILAHHPHVLQPVENIEVTLNDGNTREGIVFYSLGNFISNQMGQLEQLAGAIAYVTITRDNTTGEITIDSAEYLPIWCYIAYNREKNSKSYCVLPAGQVLDNPQLFADIDAEAIESPLEDTWDLATKRMGEDTAHPLRSVPIR